MKIPVLSRDNPILQKIWSPKPKSCLAACVATFTGVNPIELDGIVQGAYLRARMVGNGVSVIESTNIWIDAVNRYLADETFCGWQIVGPLSTPPPGISICVCDPPDPQDTSSHAVLVRRTWKLEIVHDPGYVPYEFEPNAYFFLAFTHEPENLNRGFTQHFIEKHEGAPLFPDDPPF